LSAKSDSENGSSAVWIFTVFVFLLCLIAVHALIEFVINGPSFNINILSVIGGTLYVSALAYLLLSALAASLSIGCFCSHVIRKLKKTGANVTFDVLEAKLENNEKKIERALDKDITKLSLDQFMVSRDLKSINRQIKENQTIMEKIGKVWEAHEKAVNKQAIALSILEKKLEKIESRIVPVPYLAAASDVKEITGVGEKTAESLKAAGIGSVEDLIIEDPAIIAQKTNISESNIAKIQTIAELLMIPGINSKTVKLLQKAGVSSVEELARQNPIHLFKKITIISGKKEEKPTLEELALHIRLAQYYATHAWDTIPVVSFPKEIAMRSARH
jgi:predicted flap endonuclease-1-like 5' DNA nuclease